MKDFYERRYNPLTAWHEDVVKQYIEQLEMYPNPVITWRWVGYNSNRVPSTYHIAYQLDNVSAFQYPYYLSNVYRTLCDEYIALRNHYGLTRSGVPILNDDFTDHLCVIRDKYTVDLDRCGNSGIRVPDLCLT